MICTICKSTISTIAELHMVPCRGGYAHGPCAEMQARATPAGVCKNCGARVLAVLDAYGCKACGHKDSTPDVQSRATVGSSFVEAPVVLERPAPRHPRPSVSDHTIESLTGMITRTLSVPAMSGETYSQWLSGRCAALVQLLINDWGGSCPSCGPTVLRELSDITEEMPLAPCR